MELFSLKPFTRFRLNNIDYEMKCIKKEFRPTLGRVYVAIAIDLDNNRTQKFLSNWEVEEIQEKIK